METKKDTLVLGGKEFTSRFILGSGKYSMELIKAAVEQAGAQIITLAVRRTNTRQSENILDYIPDNVTLLPNTSGARTAEEAVRIARMSRELGLSLIHILYGKTIPVVDRTDLDPVACIETGDWVRVDGEKGTVEILKKKV